ncbi:TRAP-type C4-dicarboxylate transport system permease small subunit [Roseovarius halotolerans]|uniref:TRAP transporter small permease protein n=1 Tax=Roseovarius halotolerans TaxID=505353 RepID=A0A1X6YDK8_9RHOB|nr:TRAP transporter small permease [Roseovarius halotolerans]RKT34949.1 TRAP-type C4-dicarboxylate transport system permease small subunit [Roseovarius halotolerans]SLN16359.1 2,3-diketo-L-gulonate TRAP transporter small permease protein YiaM [Roseovarius halotolerans]
MIARLLSLSSRLELVLANTSLAALVLVLAAQIFFRYVLQIGLSWSEEISRFLFVWFVYISASLAAHRGSHIRVTLFARFLPVPDRYLFLLADAIWVVFNGFVVVAGLMLVQRTLTYPVYSTSLFIPLAYIYLVIPLAHALMILRILERQWRAWKHGEPLIAAETVVAEEAAR